MDEELESLEVQMADLQQRQAQLSSRRKVLLRRLEEACEAAQPSSSSSTSSKSKSKSTQSAAAMSQKELQRYDGSGTTEKTSQSLAP